MRKKGKIGLILLIIILLFGMLIFTYTKRGKESSSNLKISSSNIKLKNSNNNYSFDIIFDNNHNDDVSNISIDANDDNIECDIGSKKIKAHKSKIIKCRGNLSSSNSNKVSRKIDISYEVNSKKYHKSLSIKIKNNYKEEVTNKDTINNQNNKDIINYNDNNREKSINDNKIFNYNNNQKSNKQLNSENVKDNQIIEGIINDNKSEESNVEYVDYNELYNIINNYKNSLGYINNWYTEETQDKVDNYIKNIDDKFKDKQSIVNQYVIELSILINELELKMANYENLNNLIEQYENSEGYINDWYTIESQEPVENCINELDLNLTIDKQYVVDNYVTELFDLINQLEYKNASYLLYDAWLETIYEDEPFINNWFTEESKTNLIEYINGIDRGKSIVEQDYVDQYTNNLQNMYLYQMEYIRADYSVLMNKINEYYESPGYINGWYTIESQEPVDNLLNSISLDITINNQEIVDNYLEQLVTLTNKLQYRGANYLALNEFIEIIENSEAYLNHLYTDESQEKLNNYIDSIDRYKKANEQDVVNNYLTQLTIIYNELEYISLNEIISKYHSNDRYINDWYTDDTKQIVENYINSIDLDNINNEQECIIELVNLINQLELKDASYDNIDSLISKYQTSYDYINNLFTEESKQEVDDYINLIYRGFKIDKQEIVDNYFSELKSKIFQLKLKEPKIFKSPLKYEHIRYVSAEYGYKLNNLHDGMDIVAPYGTPVYSVGNGTVFRVYNDQVNGKSVVIYHIVDGQPYTSTYYHLSNYNVSVGQVVTSETIIGNVGNTGASTGTHLHLTVARGRLYTDYQYNVINHFTVNPRNVIFFPPSI